MALPKYDTVVLDAMNHAYRCWWPHRSSTTHLGRDNSVERGFILGLLTLLQRHAGGLLVLAWDGEPVRQIAENPAYKNGRADNHVDRPSDWHDRCDRLREVLAGVFHTLYEPESEADQEIARFVKGTASRPVLIVSTDADLLMLLNDHVDVLRPGRNAGPFTVHDFRREYGFEPENLVLYRALIGDRSDNIVGLSRFPKAVAQRLAGSLVNVDRLYRELHLAPPAAALQRLTTVERQKLLAGEQQVRSNVRLIDLLSDSTPAHLSRPAGLMGPLLSLLGDLDSTDLADAMSWEMGIMNRAMHQCLATA